MIIFVLIIVLLVTSVMLNVLEGRKLSKLHRISQNHPPEEYGIHDSAFQQLLESYTLMINFQLRLLIEMPEFNIISNSLMASPLKLA